MRISIVTISFNQAKYLRECINSVLEQDHEDVELIVVDPGSTDGSRELIETFRNRLIAVLEPDGGPADGLNKGFALATGDVFGFVNSDDALLPGALLCVARHFASKPDCGVVAGCGYFVDADGRQLRRVVSSRFTPWLYAHGAVSLFQPGTFFRARSFRRVGGFNAANGTCWDGELFLDMAASGSRFATVSDDLGLFRLHDGSITGTGRLNEQFRKDCDRLFAKVTGRERGSQDWALDKIARIMKYGSDPLYLVRRLSPHSNKASRR